MSTKPTTLPTWDSGSVNLVAPTGGHQASGFAANEVPTSSEMNGLLQLIGKWAQYLNDGAFTGGASVAGGLAVDTLGASGLITANAGVTVASGQNVVIAGTGLYKRGAKVTKVPAMAGNFSGSNGFSPTSWVAGANGQILAIPINLDEGERLTQVTARVACGATDVIRLRVFRTVNIAGLTQSTVQLGSSVTSSGHSGLVETITDGSLTEVCSSADSFNYVAELDVTAFAAAPTVFGIEITTDVP